MAKLKLNLEVTASTQKEVSKGRLKGYDVTITKESIDGVVQQLYYNGHKQDDNSSFNGNYVNGSMSGITFKPANTTDAEIAIAVDEAIQALVSVEVPE